MARGRALALCAALLILSYYAVVAGWSAKYLVDYALDFDAHQHHLAIAP